MTGSRPTSGEAGGGPHHVPAHLEPLPASPTKKKKKKKKKQSEELPPPQAHGWGARPIQSHPPPLQGNIGVCFGLQFA